MKNSLGRWLVLGLTALLPWSVIISVMTTYQLNMGVIGSVWKEATIALIAILVIFQSRHQRHLWKVDTFDILVIAFASVLIGVSIIQGISLKGMAYGLRYDVGFLGALLIFRRAFSLWGISLHDVLRVFLISGGCMLGASILVRYIFGESFLTVFGFSPQVSVWEGSGAPPIYHGIPGASVIRFQGLLEGPNQMAYFLLLYIGAFLTWFAALRKYRFLTVFLGLTLVFFLIQTYSRSGYLGIFGGTCIVLGFSLYSRFRDKKTSYKSPLSLKKVGIISLILGVIGVISFFQFSNKFAAIFERHGSTSGHFERMYIGILRFWEEPWGQGLAESGPASRAVRPVNQDPAPVPEDAHIQKVVDRLAAKNPDFVFTTETYYIPESWYIQIMTEGGILAILCFGMILMLILWTTKKYPYLLGALVGVYVMNIFLHSFESVHSSYLLAGMVAGTLLGKNGHK